MHTYSCVIQNNSTHMRSISVREYSEATSLCLAFRNTEAIPRSSLQLMRYLLSHWTLGDVAVFFKVLYDIQRHMSNWLLYHFMKLPPGDGPRTSVISRKALYGPAFLVPWCDRVSPCYTELTGFIECVISHNTNSFNKLLMVWSDKEPEHQQKQFWFHSSCYCQFSTWLIIT